MPEPSGGSSPSSSPGTGGRFWLYTALVAALIVVLVAMNVLVLAFNDPNRNLGPHYYLALGDSLSFGYQPNLDFHDGFVDEVYSDLRNANVTNLTNYGCAGETTASMISGGCPGRAILHDRYAGNQLDAAVAFLEAHRGQVSPVTLEIGANDVLPDFSPTTCSKSASGDADLARMDQNITQVILPRLVAALQTPDGARAGDLHLLNYYNPYAKQCASSQDFIHVLNEHLAADAVQFQVPVIDVYTAFGGDAGMAANVCAARNAYTWICDQQFHDIHPTTDGYGVIAAAVETALGYPGSDPSKHLPQAAPTGVPPATPAPTGTPPTLWRPNTA